MTWTDHFPELGKLPEPSHSLVERAGRVVSLPAGAIVFGPGQPPQNYLLLIKGTVRVHQLSEAGREIVLYRVTAGESCAMTTACLIGDEVYQAEGVAETPIEAVALPKVAFDEAIAKSPEFRRFVFAALSSRMTNLFREPRSMTFLARV